MDLEFQTQLIEVENEQNYLNKRLIFLENKYEDYEFSIINKFIQCRKKGNKRFHRVCISFDCIKLAGFCRVGETKATHCKDCSVETGQEMEDLKHKNDKCTICKKILACFCIKGGNKPTHCGKCKDDGMIDIHHRYNMCINCNITRANYAKIGETTPTHCAKCSKDGMEDINNKQQRCKNIIDNENCKTYVFNKQYEGYCYKCFYKLFPDKICFTNYHIKENAVFDFIKLIYTQEISDKFKIEEIRFNKECGHTKKNLI